jgi:hypothetical protein
VPVSWIVVGSRRVLVGAHSPRRRTYKRVWRSASTGTIGGRRASLMGANPVYQMEMHVVVA